MSAFVLHVSRPDRLIGKWSIPDAIEGQSAHYLCDNSYPDWDGVKVGSRIFLWGTKKIGKYGLFASGICKNRDGLIHMKGKPYDSFMLILHERVLHKPLNPEGLTQEYECLGALVEKITAPGHLKLLLLSEAEEKALHAALSKPVKGN